MLLARLVTELWVPQACSVLSAANHLLLCGKLISARLFMHVMLLCDWSVSKAGHSIVFGN